MLPQDRDCAADRLDSEDDIVRKGLRTISPINSMMFQTIQDVVTSSGNGGNVCGSFNDCGNPVLSRWSEIVKANPG